MRTSKTRRAIAAIALAALFMTGCAITDYPIVEDDRGDYSGIIRTAHKAYIVPSAQVATVYADGSDQLFSMVLQNQYGDQTLYTFNNFDPTGAVSFLDQTYCDWNFEDCEVVRAWNPRQNDDPFDYEFFDACSGARSLSILMSQESRIGECGDDIFNKDPRALARLFSELDVTTWRGEKAYLAPLIINNFYCTFTSRDGQSERMPVFGRHELILTDDLSLVAPMAPNMRHQMMWANDWIARNGNFATVYIAYRGVQGKIDVNFKQDGLTYNLSRF